MLRNNNTGREGQEKKNALKVRPGLLENASAPQSIGVPKRFGPIEVIFLGEIDRKARVEVRNTETGSNKILDIQVGQIRSVDLEGAENDSTCATCVELMLVYVSPVSASIEITPSIDVSVD